MRRWEAISKTGHRLANALASITPSMELKVILVLAPHPAHLVPCLHGISAATDEPHRSMNIECKVHQGMTNSDTLAC